MRIDSVAANNRRRVFEIETDGRHLSFPYAKAEPVPTAGDPLVSIWIDDELGCEALTYTLSSGAEGSVHVEQFLEYNRDPGYMRDLLLYSLTVEACERVEAGVLSRREIIRRLGTSPSQLYRLLDTTNYRKSVDQMLHLLQVLGCDVDLVVREEGGETRPARRKEALLAALAEDETDLRAFAERSGEPAIAYEEMLVRLKAGTKP